MSSVTRPTVVPRAGVQWTRGLEHWYAANGRHDLPWRHTTDPWAVLVSEVMLQQTSVARVLPRWGPFLRRWPRPSDLAAAPLTAVLAEWQGLGYPRRARSLWLCAQSVAVRGWPAGEAGLRTLPGVGVYTARALLAFSSLGGPGGCGKPPRDVNLARVSARAALGVEPHETTPAALDGALAAARPRGMSARDYGYALFDAGALHCRARPVCEGCPLATACLARRRGIAAPLRTTRQPRYRGSLRQLRGALLAASLTRPDASPAQLAQAVATVPGATGERVRLALEGLARDGLLTGTDPGGRPETAAVAPVVARVG